MVDPDQKEAVLTLLTEGRPYVLIEARDHPGTRTFSIEMSVGGGIADDETIRALLSKTLSALDRAT